MYSACFNAVTDYMPIGILGLHVKLGFALELSNRRRLIANALMLKTSAIC